MKRAFLLATQQRSLTLYDMRKYPYSINELGRSPAFKAHQKDMQCAFLHFDHFDVP